MAGGDSLEGWVKLHRQLKSHWVYSNSELLHIWIHILLSATHDYCTTLMNGKIVDLFPGQLVFGRKKWAKELKMDPNKIYRAIKLFENTKMISIYSTNKYSILTVCNWSSYQRFFENGDSEHQNAHQSKHQNEHQNEHQQIAKKEYLEVSSEHQNEHQNEHTDEQQNDTYKNVKNVKKKEDIYIDIFNHWISKKIVVHRKLTSKMKTKINSAMKEYDVDTIKAAIDTYAEIVLNDKYWFTHKWSLDDFLQRGLSKFENREIAIQNYLKSEYKGGPNNGTNSKNYTDGKDFGF